MKKCANDEQKHSFSFAEKYTQTHVGFKIIAMMLQDNVQKYFDWQILHKITLLKIRCSHRRIGREHRQKLCSKFIDLSHLFKADPGSVNFGREKNLKRKKTWNYRICRIKMSRIFQNCTFIHSGWAKTVFSS